MNTFTKSRHSVDLFGPVLVDSLKSDFTFNFISDLNVFIQIAKAKFVAVENFVKEKYKASLEFEDENEAFKFIAEKAGVANGGRGLLNTIETYIVNPLAEWIFMRSDGVEGRRIKITLIRSIFDFDFV